MSLSIQTNVAMPKYQMAFKGKEQITNKADDILREINKKIMPAVEKESKVNTFFEKVLRKLFPKKAYRYSNLR